MSTTTTTPPRRTATRSGAPRTATKPVGGSTRTATSRPHSARPPAPVARWPFVILLAALAAAGIIALLMLNTATAETSFTLKKKQTELDALTQKQQSLQKKVSAKDAPEALAAKAAELGMVPGPQPGYLVLKPDGTSEFVTPSAQAAPPPPPPPPTTAAASTTAPASAAAKKKPAAAKKKPAGTAPSSGASASSSAPSSAPAAGQEESDD